MKSTMFQRSLMYSPSPSSQRLDNSLTMKPITKTTMNSSTMEGKPPRASRSDCRSCCSIHGVPNISMTSVSTRRDTITSNTEGRPTRHQGTATAR